MAETRYYKVAGHRFSVTGEAEGFANYEPFGCDGGETLFALRIERGEVPSFSEEFRQEEEGEEIVCGMTADGESVFEFLRPFGSWTSQATRSSGKRPEVERYWQKEVAGW